MKVTSKLTRVFNGIIEGKSITIPAKGSVTLKDELAAKLVESHPDCFDVDKDDKPGAGAGHEQGKKDPK